MHNIENASHALLELDAEMRHGSIEMLTSKYYRDSVDQGKVVVELLNHPTQIDNINPIFTS